jgi:hypothetical protein
VYNAGHPHSVQIPASEDAIIAAEEKGTLRSSHARKMGTYQDICP